MDAKRKRNKILADTNEFGYVWTGPKRLTTGYESPTI